MDRHGCLSVRDKAGVTVKAPAQFFQIVCHVVLAVSLGFRRVDKRIEEPAPLLRLSQSAVFLRKGLGQERKSGDDVVYGILRRGLPPGVPVVSVGKLCRLPDKLRNKAAGGISGIPGQFVHYAGSIVRFNNTAY